jgi:hypothetical protein
MSLVLQSSGGGQITIQEPATASNFTQTLPAATGTVMVSGNMPAFRAFVGTGANQTGLTSGASVLSQLTTEDFDTASCFNNTGSTVGGIPAYSFLPNVAGYYQVTFQLYVTGDTANITAAEPLIYKNGAIVSAGTYISEISASAGLILNAVDTIYMNGTTDYFQFYSFANTVSGTWTNRNPYTFATAFLARTA